MLANALPAATVSIMMRTLWNSRLVIGAVGGTAIAIVGAAATVGLLAAHLLHVPFGIASAATVLGSATAKASLIWSKYAIEEVQETRQ